MSRVVFFIAMRQLWDRKLLNGIAVCGVSLGVLTLIAINGIMQGFQHKFIDNILRISPHVTLFDRQLRPAPPLLARAYDGFVVTDVAHQSPSERNLRISRPEEIVRALEDMSEVVAASKLLVGSAVISRGSQQFPVEVRGIEPTRQDRVTPIASYLQVGNYHTLEASPDAVVIGSGIASRIGAHLGEVIVCGSSLGTRLNLKVVGIYESGIPPVDNHRVYVTLRNAQALLGRPDAVGRIEVKLREPDNAQVMSSKFEHMFAYDGESWQETNANFLALFVQQNAIIGFVVGAILAVGGFGVLAIQIMIVLQKTRDIAILRSVGFRRSDILGCFLLQGAIISLAGAAVGDIAGHYVIQMLGKLKSRTEGLVKSEYFLVYEDPRYYYYGFAFALSVGLLASLIPAVRGSRVEPVDVLRGQLG